MIKIKKKKITKTPCVLGSNPRNQVCGKEKHSLFQICFKTFPIELDIAHCSSYQTSQDLTSWRVGFVHFRPHLFPSPSVELPYPSHSSIKLLIQSFEPTL